MALGEHAKSRPNNWRHCGERPGIDAVAGAWSETHPHRGGGSLRPEPLCGFGERRAEVMAFHAQLAAVGRWGHARCLVIRRGGMEAQ